MKRWRRWFSRNKEWEQDMQDELRYHIERQIAANISAGLAPEEARRQAVLQLGAIEGVKVRLPRTAQRLLAGIALRRRPLRPAHPSQIARLHHHRHSHSGPRHRREYRHLYSRQRSAARSARGSTSRRAASALLVRWPQPTHPFGLGRLRSDCRGRYLVLFFVSGVPAIAPRQSGSPGSVRVQGARPPERHH